MDYNKLGTTVCYLLRHNPTSRGLVLDKYGYCPIRDLALALNGPFAEEPVRVEDLVKMAELDEKNRYTIHDGFIKCNYGHSIDVELEPQENLVDEIPDVLYHGTTVMNAKSIRETGLQSRQRNYVHVTDVKEMAELVGLRYGKQDDNVVILEIDSKQMVEDGVPIHSTDSSVYLVEFIDPKYIKN